jgi:hypothetical protein
MSNWIDNVTGNVAKAVMGGVALVVTTAMATTFNKPTKEYVDFKDNEIRKELLNLRDVHNSEFKSLERTIKIEMDALRKNIEDWRQSDKDKYEIILKLIDKQNNN